MSTNELSADREKQVWAQEAELRRSLDSLEKATQTLEESLVPVVSEAQPRPQSGDNETKALPLVGFAERLRDDAWRVKILTDKIMSLHERLEV